MHFLYIIYSKSVDKYYSGETDNVEIRLKKHIENTYDGSFTKIASDWELKLAFECKVRSEALFLESFIKRMKSRKFIRKIISNTYILTDILNNK